MRALAFALLSAAAAPSLPDGLEYEQRTIASGAGSSATIVGSGTDDTMDALDRRVEFTPFDCS